MKIACTCESGSNCLYCLLTSGDRYVYCPLTSGDRYDNNGDGTADEVSQQWDEYEKPYQP